MYSYCQVRGLIHSGNMPPLVRGDDAGAIKKAAKNVLNADFYFHGCYAHQTQDPWVRLEQQFVRIVYTCSLHSYLSILRLQVGARS